MLSDPILYSTDAYAYLRDELADLSGFETGLVKRERFPDGELYQRIETSPAGKHAVLIGGTIDDANTIELLHCAHWLVDLGALSLTIVIPYFGYSTMERDKLPGEIVTAKVQASLISDIPRASLGNRVVLLDLHKGEIKDFFDKDIQRRHIYAKSVVLAAVQDLGGDNYVLGATDSGRADWIESHANALNVDPVFVWKDRISGSETKVKRALGDPSGKRVVIYDDMIRTGSSLVGSRDGSKPGAVQTYKQRGAESFAVVSTHAVLPADSAEHLQNCGLVDKVIVTNSHPRALEIENDFFEVRSIAPVLVPFLRWGT